MLDTIKDLYKFNRTLVGDDFDKSLEYIKGILPGMNILEFPTGMEYGTWKVPQKWTVRDAWIKYKDKKILDFKKEPLSVIVGSIPIHGTVDKKELMHYVYNSPMTPDSVPYVFKYYEKDWGFSMPTSQFAKLKDGEYEVFIDSEYTDGTLKIGEYIIPGGKKEILITAHLDHPFQANDNLSGVAVAIELAKKLKTKYTVRILFVPETIGTMAYVYTQDLSNVEFGITLDMVGNKNTIMMQETFAQTEKINKAGVMAMSLIAKETYRKGPFRAPLGAEDYIFNDPLIGIPTIFFTRHPYDEYHTNKDTVDIIDEKMLKETVKIVKKTIQVYEKDWTPVRSFKGPLMRSRFKAQQPDKETNRKFDYFFYLMDGERTLLDLAYSCQLDFDKMNKLLKQLLKDGFVSKNIQKPGVQGRSKK